MKEADSLLRRARKYLASSKLLIEAEDFESAVSRAYYAMFYTAEAALLIRGIAASTHKGVIASFGEQFIRTGIFPKDLGRDLTTAFEKRQLGDYEYVPVIERREAVEILDSAAVFVEKMAEWLAVNGTTERVS